MKDYKLFWNTQYDNTWFLWFVHNKQNWLISAFLHHLKFRLAWDVWLSIHCLRTAHARLGKEIPPRTAQQSTEVALTATHKQLLRIVKDPQVACYKSTRNLNSANSHHEWKCTKPPQKITPLQEETKISTKVIFLWSMQLNLILMQLWGT